MANLLIENGAVLTMDEEHRIHDPGWVWVEGDRIAQVGEGLAPALVRSRAERIIDAAQMAVLPGLINGHTHLSQTFMRGLADDKPLIAWLKNVMWPVQAAMTPEDVQLASLLGLVENLHCGVTGVVQHHKITSSPAHVDAAAEAAQQVGLRLLLARGWVDLGSGAESPESILEEVAGLRQRWHGGAEGRIGVAFGPMAPWRCSDDTMRRTVEQARQWGVPTHLHVAEAQDELDMLRQRTGLRHVEWLHSLGVLGPDVHLVHSVWVNEAELDLVADSGAIVVHCPVSNMYLASGVAPVRQMLDRGIPVALGSDGPASHNSQDMLETLKVAALLAKVSLGQPTALRSMEALHMATVAGARLFGTGDQGQAPSGRLVAGTKADIALIDLNNARSMPVHRPESAVVYNANGPDVHTVLVDGRILLDAGRVTMLDEAGLLERCRRAARELLRRAQVQLVPAGG